MHPNRNLWTRVRRLARSAVVTLVAASFAGCEYFEDTVIPLHDSGAPLALGSRWEDGQRFVGPNVSRVSSDPTVGWVVLGACYDWSGAHRVEMYADISVTYDTGHGFTTSSFTSQVPAVMQAAGQPGDQVSNGVFVARYVRPADWADPNGKLVSIRYRPLVLAEDFHGNTAAQYGPTLIHQP